MRGVLYTIAVLPWQHPDEPTHFENLCFIAETNRFSTADDFSILLRWEIVASMNTGGLLKGTYDWYGEERWKIEGDFRPSSLRFAWISVFIAIFISLTQSLMVQGLSHYLSHGRHLIVAMIPISLLIVVGSSQWVPNNKFKYAGIAFAVFLIVFDAVSIWGFLVPAYY